MLFVRQFVRVDIIFTCGKHLHDQNFSLKGDAWAHRTSIALHF